MELMLKGGLKMNEEVKLRLERFILDEIDKTEKLARGSEEHARACKVVVDATRELNSLYKTEKEAAIETEKNAIEDEKLARENRIRELELKIKEAESVLEGKKSKRDLIGRIVTAALSVGLMLGIPIAEHNGLFVRKEKMIKF